MSCIKGNIIYVAPRIGGGKVVDSNKIEIRLGIKTPKELIGKKVFINHPNYPKKLHKVIGTWSTAPSGGTLFLQTTFNDIGHRNSAGLPTDRTGGGFIVICDTNDEINSIANSGSGTTSSNQNQQNNNQGGNVGTTTSNQDTGKNTIIPTEKKSKIGLYVGIGVGALVVIGGGFALCCE